MTVKACLDPHTLVHDVAALAERVQHSSQVNSGVIFEHAFVNQRHTNG
jgi:hypothetical protein